jgi:hypothetical protein
MSEPATDTSEVTPLDQTPVDADYLTPNWYQNESYTAQNDRSLISSLFASEGGIVNPGDFAVNPRGAGANLSVDVSSGWAAVVGTDAPSQGTYLDRLQAIKNFPLTAVPGAGLSRYDLVIVRNYDAAVLGAISSPPWDIEVIAGTPAASPSIPAVPKSSIPLAVLGPITNSTTQITSALITDRRTRAAGGVLAYAEVTAPQTGFPVTTWVTVTGTTISFNVPGPDRRIRVAFWGTIAKGSGDPAGQQAIGLWDATTEWARTYAYCVPAFNAPFAYERVLTLPAGRYTWHMQIYSFQGFSNTAASATNPVVVLIEDIGT